MSVNGILQGQSYSREKVDELLEDKLDKGLDYVTVGQATGTTIGSNSTIEGLNNTVTGIGSHAEGHNNVVTGNYSHVEGEGNQVNYDFQSVSGKYNVPEAGMVEIVGWGESNSNRKNIRTLDTNGNETIAGQFSVGNITPTNDMDAATKYYVDNSLANKVNISNVPTAATTTPLMDGIASAGSSVAYARADHIHPTDTSRAPVNHATSTTTYGAGNASNYGHVRLYDSTLGNSFVNEDAAATPKALQDFVDMLNDKANLSDLPTAATTEPLMDGTASTGTGTAYARADHRHPVDTSRAPTNHAVSTNIYGIGTDNNYGHVKLSDSTTDSTNGVSNGIAATPKAINLLYTAANAKAVSSDMPTASSTAPKMNGTATTGTLTTYARGTHIHPTDTGRAPVAHASTATTYGKGTDTKYGHVKLSDATDSTSGVSGGIAATPKALKTVYDLIASKATPSAIPSAATTTPVMNGTVAIGTSTAYSKYNHKHPSDTSRAPTAHASTATTYGVGTASNYGHVKLSDTVNSDAASSSKAATPKALQTVVNELENITNSSFIDAGEKTTSSSLNNLSQERFWFYNINRDTIFSNYTNNHIGYDSQKFQISMYTGSNYVGTGLTVMNGNSGNAGFQIVFGYYDPGEDYYYTDPIAMIRVRKNGAFGSWYVLEPWKDH